MTVRNQSFRLFSPDGLLLQALAQNRIEVLDWQAHDVAEEAVVAGDDAFAVFLGSVGSGLVEGVDEAQIFANGFFTQGPKGDGGCFEQKDVVGVTPADPHQSNPRCARRGCGH